MSSPLNHKYLVLTRNLNDYSKDNNMVNPMSNNCNKIDHLSTLTLVNHPPILNCNIFLLIYMGQTSLSYLSRQWF
jgi:hypothetical protein